MRRRIALFGNFGVGNLGNEATLQAMMENLRRRLPGLEIRCICSGPEKAARDYAILAAPISAPRQGRRRTPTTGPAATRPPQRTDRAPSRLRSVMRMLAQPALEAYRVARGIAALRGCECLIMTGTGMLGDHALQPEIFRWAVIAKLCRCKLLLVSVGGGLARRPLNRWFVRAAAALAEYRSYRDAVTKECLAAMGADVTNDPVYPDLAFSLRKERLRPGQRPDGRSPVVGVGVMNWYGAGGAGKDTSIYCEYLHRVALLVVRLLERGYGVRILIGDTTYDEPVRLDLRKALQARGVRFDVSRVSDEPAASVDELLAQLAAVDAVVSPRFHNLLLAMMLGKPVFAISYHLKFQPLMDSMGLGEFCQDIEHIDVDGLLGKLVVLEENAAEITLRTAREMEACRVALDEQYDRILALLPRRPAPARNAANTPAGQQESRGV
jgi:polysaccharide pyruvyl transferase WcaK-like protein